jgi:DNA-binding MarR family transcriptional regulator
MFKIARATLNCMNAWLNLQQFLVIVKNETDFGSLDDMSQRVLEWVMRTHDAEKPLFVQGIVLESRVASPATIHKCLATLDRTGFLQFKTDPEDARRRIVAPTRKARKTFDALSKRVAKWAVSRSR